jgi:hypothetical protein
MKPPAEMKSRIAGSIEFLIVSALILLLLSGLFGILYAGDLKPHYLDPWSLCYALQHLVTRILGMNPGGLWDRGFFYPYNQESLLFSEPCWGVALLVAPVWLFVKNIFIIYRLGDLVALFLSWIATYYFIKALGCGRRWAFFAGGMFCFAGVTLQMSLYCHHAWPFFPVPLLGLVTVKLFSTRKWVWAGLWGLLFGFLAWSSLQFFIMGGAFAAFFIAWHLAFKEHSRKAIILLLAAILFGCLIAGMAVVPIYWTHQKFGLYRNFHLQYEWATNWANLIFRGWLPLPYNPLVKMPFWGQLEAHARGAANIGLSILLLLAALLLFVVRLKPAYTVQVSKRWTVSTLLLLMGFMTVLAWLNMQSITYANERYHADLPALAVGWTYFYYFIAGAVIYVFRHQLSSALRHLDFYLFLVAVFFGFLAFGPYYLTPDGKAVASPAAFLLFNVPGFNGMGVPARWGMILAFTLSIAVAVFLSQYDTGWKRKIASAAFILLCFLEVCPGIKLSGFHRVPPYEWQPGEVDVFLRDLPDGAVLEMSDYPLKVEQECPTRNCCGERLFARTFHKKLLVNGYASHTPPIIDEYLYHPNAVLSHKAVKNMRKFGARYWVIHMEGWPEAKVRLFKGVVGDLRQIAYFDKDKTAIYEDPHPKISVGKRGEPLPDVVQKNGREISAIEGFINGSVDLAGISQGLIQKLAVRDLTGISKFTSIREPELKNFRLVFNKIELKSCLSGEEINALYQSCGDVGKKAGACIEYQMEDKAFFANVNNESKDFIFNVKVNGKAKGALQVFFPAKNGQPIIPKIVKISVMLPKEGNTAVYAEISRRLARLKRKEEFDARLSKSYASIADAFERWFGSFNIKNRNVH